MYNIWKRGNLASSDSKALVRTARRGRGLLSGAHIFHITTSPREGCTTRSVFRADKNEPPGAKSEPTQLLHF